LGTTDIGIVARPNSGKARSGAAAWRRSLGSDEDKRGASDAADDMNAGDCQGLGARAIRAGALERRERRDRIRSLRIVVRASVRGPDVEPGDGTTTRGCHCVTTRANGLSALFSSRSGSNDTVRVRTVMTVDRHLDARAFACSGVCLYCICYIISLNAIII
jgi:hypothetical protein